jgi:hypothetical protein
MKNLFVCIFVLHVVFSFSQQKDDNIAAIIADIYKSYTEEEEKELDFDSFMDELLTLSEDPVNLNNATRNDLAGLVFLTENQIENLLFYIYQSEGLVNLYELQLVDGLDMTDINRMLPFVTLGDKPDNQDFPSWYELMKYAKSELVLRLDLFPQLKKGYISTEDNPKKYQGENFYNYVKYQYDFRKRVTVGFTAEKDAGEAFFQKEFKGYDFMSAFIQVNKVGIFDKIVLGDFKASFGQGLIIKQGGSRTAGAGLSNLIQINQGFQKYSSVGEYGYLRGMASTLSLGRFKLQNFVSFRKLDGNYADSVLKSINLSGYHRTENEVAEKQNLNNFTAGISLCYSHKNMLVGLTGLYNQFADSLLPDTKPYNIFRARTSKGFFPGINYRIRTGKFNLFGELAINNALNPAFLSGFTFIPVSGITMGGLFRYYDPAYDNPFAAAFSKKSQTANETGFFSGIEIETIKKLKISFQSDIYKFPWLQYGVDFPARGEEYRLRLIYTPSGKSSLNFNFKFKKQDDAVQNDQNQTQFPLAKISLTSRIQFQHLVGPCEFSSNFEIKSTHNNSRTLGTALWQNFSFYKPDFPVKFDLRWMVFDIPDYDNRIYSYENDVLHAFTIPACYGRGSRLYALIRYTLNNNIDIYLKLAETIYADGRLTVGSGYDTINGSRKTDVRLLFRWKISHF